MTKPSEFAISDEATCEHCNTKIGQSGSPRWFHLRNGLESCGFWAEPITQDGTSASAPTTTVTDHGQASLPDRGSIARDEPESECLNKFCLDGWVDHEVGTQDGRQSYVEQVPCQVCCVHSDPESSGSVDGVERAVRHGTKRDEFAEKLNWIAKHFGSLGAFFEHVNAERQKVRQYHASLPAGSLEKSESDAAQMKRCSKCGNLFHYPPSDNKADATLCAYCSPLPAPPDGDKGGENKKSG